MTRFTLFVLAALLATGCYHDNASPFVHGGGNRPETWGSTWAPASGTRVPEAGSGSYSASSGYAGGYEMEAAAALPATTTNMGTSPNPMSAPAGAAPPATTATAPARATRPKTP